MSDSRGVRVKRTPLPGVGLRLELTAEDGHRVGVIHRQRGGVEFFISRQDDPDLIAGPGEVDSARGGNADRAVWRLDVLARAVASAGGSNAANMSVLLFADAAYVDGPILASVVPTQIVAAVGAILLMALAVAAIVGGTETRIRRLEPDAVVPLFAYVGAVVAVALAV